MKYIFVTVLLSFFFTGFSQVRKRWSLEACMRYAVENSPKKKRQELENRIYKQDYIEAIGALLPSLNGGTNVYFNFGRSVDNETNTYTNLNTFSNGYSLYSSLTLFDGLSNVAKIKIQKINRLQGKQQLQEQEDLIAYDTMEAFLNVLYYKEMVAFAEGQLEESRANLKQASRMNELGIKSFPDVVEMEAKEAADLYELTKQQNLLKIGIILLKDKMFYPIEEELEIDGVLPEVLIAKSPEAATGIFERSRNFLPKALAAEFSVQSQRMSYLSAKGRFFPSIKAEGGYSTSFSHYMDGSTYPSFAEQFRDRRGYYVGFSLSIPLFNGFSSFTQLKKARFQLLKAESERDEVLRTLYSEIEQAVADMNGETDAYYQAKKQTAAMSVAYRVNQRKYAEGLVSVLDLHMSSNNLFKAKAEELNAKLKYYLKQRLVDYYRGETFIKE